MSQEHTFFLVVAQGRTLGRVCLTYTGEKWQRQVLRRRYADHPSATMVLDPDQRYPADGGPPVGRYTARPTLTEELARLAKRHTKDEIRQALEALP